MPAYRVTTILTGVPGSPFVSSHYFDSAVMTTPAAAVTAVGNFWSAVDAGMHEDISWATESEVATFIDPETITAYTATTPQVGVGQASDDMLPSATQALVQWRTNTVVNNRRVRGRTFIPAQVEGNNDPDGTIGGAAVTVYQAAATTLAGQGLVIPSRVGMVFAPVGTASIWAQWAVLRSRRD